MFNRSKKGYFRRDGAAVKCKCDHPAVTHWTNNGECCYPSCACKAFKPKGRKEFQNKRAVCNYGHSHDSGLETKTCFDLHCLLLAREIVGFDFHKVVALTGPSGRVIADFETDFISHYADGRIRIIECKGKHLERIGQFPLKWKLLQDKHRGDPLYEFEMIYG